MKTKTYAAMISIAVAAVMLVLLLWPGAGGAKRDKDTAETSRLKPESRQSPLSIPGNTGTSSVQPLAKSMAAEANGVDTGEVQQVDRALARRSTSTSASLFQKNPPKGDKPLDPALQKIVDAVEKVEGSIKDLRIEYTCIRRPYGSADRALTAQEQEAVSRYPGQYKPETGVFMLMGDMIRLDRTYYDSILDTQTIQQSIVIDQDSTRFVTDVPDSQDKTQALVIPGRWHGLRASFNPVLASTATGDLKLSAELRQMDGEVLPSTVTINGTDCQVVKLTKRTDSGTALRTFKVYMDPAKDYAIVKTEKYWYDLQCLERVVEVKDYETINGIHMPTQVVSTEYVRPRKSKESYPANEQVLTVKSTELNQGMSQSRFSVQFTPGTRVRDVGLEMDYKIPDTVGPLDFGTN